MAASYVLDGTTPIKDLILEVPDGGTSTAYTYLRGKAVSGSSSGGEHDIYVQRRHHPFGTTITDTNFEIDKFVIGTGKVITYESSSLTTSSYAWGLMAAGSPIELSPDETKLAVIASTQHNNQAQIYVFDVSSDLNFTTLPPDIITVSELQIEFTSEPTGLSGFHHRAEDFDSYSGTGFDFLRNYERKTATGCEFSPSGDYLYITSGGYSHAYHSNLTYLSQIDLTTTVGGDHPVRIQIQETPGTHNATTGAGPGWTTSDLSNLTRVLGL